MIALPRRHTFSQRTSQRRGAFTLLEMMISIGLIVLLMSTVFSFYNATLESRARGVARSRNVQLARVVLERMVREVRLSVADIPGYGTGLIGDKNRIELNTLTLPDRELSERRDIRTAKLPGQFDLRQIRYYIAWDEENTDTNGLPRALGLVRRESRTYLRDVVFTDEQAAAEAQADAELAVKEELYAPEIKYLEVLYFDGAQWWEDWRLAQKNSLPQMVRITVGFIPEPPQEDEEDIVEEDFLQSEEDIEPLQADRYSVIVRIAQADVFFGSRLTRQASSFGESAGR